MNTLIQSCINNKFSKTPVWLMRQAGRYLPEFRSIRKKNQDFIQLCLNTQLASEITIQPITRFNFDAAIVFSDILLVPYALGQQVNFKKNFGPDLKKIDLKILKFPSLGDFLLSMYNNRVHGAPTKPIVSLLFIDNFFFVSLTVS